MRYLLNKTIADKQNRSMTTLCCETHVNSILVENIDQQLLFLVSQNVYIILNIITNYRL